MCCLFLSDYLYYNLNLSWIIFVTFGDTICGPLFIWKYLRKNKKNIIVNDNILIKKDYIQKYYSLISIINHLGDDVATIHYTCNSLINNALYEINDDIIKTFTHTTNSSSKTCYITLCKDIDNNLETNN